MKRRYPEIPPERADDLHNFEIANEADLVLFMAGNQFMAMPELVAAFQSEHPEIKNIFYETLPPGLELRQIIAGGALFKGDLIKASADIYSSVSIAAMSELEEMRLIDKDNYFIYLHNRLVLMTPKGNPENIRKVTDLARDGVHISQPDPENEDIAHYIVDMYRQAGGEELVTRIMTEKKAQGETILTSVHHRQTPAWIVEGSVDVGPVWATEALFAQNNGLSIDVVEPGDYLDQREKVNYYICSLKRCPHPENASKFIGFIHSPTARIIYEKFGFVPEF